MKAAVCIMLLTAALSSPAGAHTDEVGFGMPASAQAATRIVHITMNDLAFNPSVIDIKPNEVVRFVITNDSAIDHDFTLGDANAQAAHRREMAEMAQMGDMATMHHDGDANAVFVQAGQTKELTWSFNQNAKIEFACNIPGHYEAGMRGTILVH